MNPNSRPGLTSKQYKILTVICEGNKNESGKWDSPVDFDELLERLSYRTSKESMQFSIRALVKRGLVVKGQERRRGALRTTFTPTESCKQMMGYLDSASFIENMDVSYLDI